MRKTLAAALILACATAPAMAAETPLDTRTTFGYQVRNPRLAYGGNRIEGWADNELGLQGQLRSGAWLYGLSFGRQKTPMTLPGLRADQNPVMAPETTDLRLRVGHVLGGGTWEIAPGLTWLQVSVSPNNQGVPYSGTPMDWAHARRGLGLSLPAALRLPGGWELLGEATAIPRTEIRLEKAPYGVGDTAFAEAKVGMGYRMGGGLRAELSYTRSLWRGGFEEDSEAYGIGLTYRPERAGE